MTLLAVSRNDGAGIVIRSCLLLLRASESTPPAGGKHRPGQAPVLGAHFSLGSGQPPSGRQTGEVRTHVPSCKAPRQNGGQQTNAGKIPWVASCRGAIIGELYLLQRHHTQPQPPPTYSCVYPTPLDTQTEFIDKMATTEAQGSGVNGGAFKVSC